MIWAAPSDDAAAMIRPNLSLARGVVRIITAESDQELVRVVNDLISTLAIGLERTDSVIEEIGPNLAAQEASLVDLIRLLLLNADRKLIAYSFP